MANPSYMGSLSVVLSQQTSIKDGTSMTFTFPSYLYTTPIWVNQNVPSQIKTITLNDILSNSNYDSVINFEISLLGSNSLNFCKNTSCAPMLNTSLSRSDGNTPPNNLQLSATNPNQYPTSFSAQYYYLPPNQLKINQSDIIKTSFNTSNFPEYFLLNVLNTCQCYDSFKLTTLNMKLNITITMHCSSNTLNTPFCIDYCTINLSQCYAPYVNYCFNGNTNFIKNINCLNFFENYIQSVGPTDTIDSNFDKYCSKFSSFSDLQSNGSQVEQSVCACHLPSTLYKDLFQQLNTQFPGLSDIKGVNQYCLYPLCSSSPYKRVQTTKQCALPNCINIVSFGKNGPIHATVNQNSGCADLGGNVVFSDTTLFYILLVLGIFLTFGFLFFIISKF